MKKSIRKIRLKSESIRSLTVEESANVHGGSMCGGGEISSCVTAFHCKPPIRA